MHHGILPDYTDFQLIENDYPFSLQYLIEAKNFNLRHNNDKVSQIAFSSKYSIRCNNIIIKYLIDEIKEKSNLIDDRPEIMQFLEGDLQFILSSSSKHLPELLDLLLISSREQIQGDSQELPLIKFFTDPLGLHGAVKSEMIRFYKEKTKGREVINCEIFTSVINLPSIHGSDESLKFFEGLANYQNPKIFHCRIIQYYIKYKWESLWYYIFFQTMILWSVIPLMFYLIFVENPNLEAVIVFTIVHLLLAIVEILQVSSMGIIQYFGYLRPEPGKAILTIVCLVVFPFIGLNVVALWFFGVLELYVLSKRAETFVQAMSSLCAFVFFSMPMLLGLSARFFLVPSLTIATLCAIFIALRLFEENKLKSLEKTILQRDLREQLYEKLIIEFILFLTIIALGVCNTIFAWEQFYVAFPLYCSSIVLLIFVIHYHIVDSTPVRMYLSSIRFGLALTYVVLDFNVFLLATFFAVIIVELSISTKSARISKSWREADQFILDLSSMACVFLRLF